MRNEKILHKIEDDTSSFTQAHNNNSSHTTLDELLNNIKIRLKDKDLEKLNFTDTKEIKRTLGNIINFLICDIETIITSYLNSVLCHPTFEKLEASWRGLKYLIDYGCLSSGIKVRVLNVKWAEISEDLTGALEFDQSQLFKKIYEKEFGTAGGEPYGILIGDYHLNLIPSPKHRKSDLEALRLFSGIAAASFAPFITSLTPASFGLESFEDFQYMEDLNEVLKQGEYRRWTLLRNEEDSRFIGLVLPHILLRKPYQGTLDFFVHRANQQNGPYPYSNYLWGNACYSFAVVVMRAFYESGWFFVNEGGEAEIQYNGLIDGPLSAFYEVEEEELIYKPVVDVLIMTKTAKLLEEAGFMVLSAQKNLPYSLFYNYPSIQKPKKYNKIVASNNAKLSSMLNNIISVSRFSHYIKVSIRDKIGKFITPQELEIYLQNWLLKYTSSQSEITAGFIFKYPIRAFNINVSQIQGQPDNFYCVLQLELQNEIDQIITTFILKFNIL